MKKEKVDWVVWWWGCFRDEDTRCLICGAAEELVWHHISYRHNIITRLSYDNVTGSTNDIRIQFFYSRIYIHVCPVLLYEKNHAAHVFRI
mgnify:CR=1 FL=1